MNNNINLPLEVINKILTMRPSHPLAKIMQKEIKHWTRRCYFNKHFFNQIKRIDFKKKRDYKYDNYLFSFKMLVEDGRKSNFDAVYLFREIKLEKERLSKKLNELNIKSYEISTFTTFPKKNKYGNFTTVKCKNNEILF